MREPLVVPRRSAPPVRWVLMPGTAYRRLVQACGPPYQDQSLSWAQLLQSMPVAPPSAVVLIDPRDGIKPVLDPRVPELLSAAGDIIPVIALLPFDRAHGKLLQQLAELRVTSVADTVTASSGTALRARLAATHAQPLKRKLEPALSSFVSPKALTLIRAAIEVAVDRGKMADLARIFSADERTVAGWCAREQLPPVRRLLAWQRILLALTLLEDPRRSVGNAAICSGYTDHSLRRALREFLGGDKMPRERTLADALSGFNAELRGLREQRDPQNARRPKSGALR